MKITKKTLEKIIKEEVRNYVIKEKVNPEIPLKLSQAAADPERAKRVANSGGQDGNAADDKVQVKPASFASGELKPSQSSMNLDKALGMAVSMMAGKMPLGGDLGAFISSDNHIMDGHHRWIATAMVNPKAKCGGRQIALPAVDLIPVLNTITVGILGITKGKPGTGGFEQFSDRELIAKKLMSTIYKNKFLKPKQAFNAVAKWAGAAGYVDAKSGNIEENEKLGGKKMQIINMAADKMVKNVSGLDFKLPANAPERIDMPVIDKGQPSEDAVAALTGGQIDWNEPYASGGAQKPAAGMNEGRRIRKRKVRVLKR